MTENPTACLLIIGNEVLSGRTRAANLQFIATRLGELGIPMREAGPRAAPARGRPPVEFNAARMRMATLPRGAVPIRCDETSAPGFSMGNVHVMAGVPRIMRAMFEALAPGLERGRPVVSRTVHAHGVYEGNIADGLSAIQARHPELDLGSYPYYRKDGPGGGVALVAKGTDGTDVEAAAREMAALLRDAGGEARD